MKTIFNIAIDSHRIHSTHLNRYVTVDFYLPPKGTPPEETTVLLINDGQDLVTMDFIKIVNELYNARSIKPLLCIGIHCGPDRRNEYGTIGVKDYRGRGAKAGCYRDFIFGELFPFFQKEFQCKQFAEMAFCGFSLGGVSALDLTWEHSEVFSKAGVFSGSLWWRMVGQDEPDFDEEEHRIMHLKIREGGYYPWLKFFFETGTQDEKADRNNNGIIDSIDDTQSLIKELINKGYDPVEDIHYLELKDGKHNVSTWARAFPAFLKWGWPAKESAKIITEKDA